VGDLWTVVLAASVALGALRPSPAPLAVGAGLALLGVARRWPAVVCLGAALLASALAQRAIAGLDGVTPRAVSGQVTLLTDPEVRGTRVVAEVRLGQRHLALEASRAAAGKLTAHLAGEHLVVRGHLEPIAVPDAWTRSRHLAGRLRLGAWSPGGPPHPVAAAANELRRSLSRGAEPLGARHASLLAGLVVGDDRGQPPDLADDFEGAGLTHLLAVSGENVAFVLVLVRPLARRLRLWPRLVLTLSAIGSFALLTRFEPSVTRAAAMAAVGAATIAVGRPTGRVRTLALAAAGLLLVDPLLVGSLGFELSVAAALAICLAAAPITAALPGPRWLAEATAVTVAAQLGVAPLLLAAFGPLPLASLPANLLVAPAAGAAMVWGMTAGVLAGVLPPSAAAVLHVPTRVLLWWIAGVADRAASAPLGQLGAPAVTALAAGLALLVATSRERFGAAGRRGDATVPRTWRRAARRVGGLLVVGAVLAAVVGAQAPPGLRSVPVPGLVRWHGSGTEVVALGGGSWRSALGVGAALAALRTARVGAIDLLVLVDGSVPASLVAEVRARHPVGRVLVPPSLAPAERPPGAVPVPPTGAALSVGRLEVLLSPVDDRLVVEAWPARREV
jgi:competence protein ComEC